MSRCRHLLRALRAPVVLATVICLATVHASPASGQPSGWSDVDETGTAARPVVFPLDTKAPHWYTDSWLAPRGGGRRHLGVDIIADRLVPVLAARDGCITYLSHSGSGNMLILTDAEGWEYRYIHLNNDTPGTDDGRNPRNWAFVGNLAQGDCVAAGQHIAYNGDSGNAEAAVPHLHFEVRRPDGIWINPYFSAKAADNAQGYHPSLPAPHSPYVGPPPPLHKPRRYVCRPVSAPAPVPVAESARGYWILGSSGRVTPVNAPSFGDLRSIGVTTAPVSMESTPPATATGS